MLATLRKFPGFLDVDTDQQNKGPEAWLTTVTALPGALLLALGTGTAAELRRLGYCKSAEVLISLEVEVRQLVAF
jgi:hypothetical protein